MITLDISQATRPLADYTRELGEDMMVLTSGSKAVAAIVSLKSVDWESISLGANPEFMAIIENARREFKEGKRISFEEMKNQFNVR